MGPRLKDLEGRLRAIEGAALRLRRHQVDADSPEGDVDLDLREHELSQARKTARSQ